MNVDRSTLWHRAASGGLFAVYAPTALILLTLALFTTENLVHYPVALMAVLGLTQAVRRPRQCLAPPARLLLLLFALIWLPMLLASFDAVASAATARTVLLYLHFLPAAYFVMRACNNVEVQRLVTAGTAMLVLFAAFDAFVQLIWHVDLFGYPYENGILKGVFHPKQRLGLFLAVFAPLCVDVVIMRWCRHYPRLWLLLIPLLIAIAMSLKRSAWIMLVLGMAAYLILHMRHNGLLFSRTRLVQFFLIGLIAAAAVAFNPALKAQLNASRGLFSMDAEQFDEATGYRWTLWQTGLDMFRAHWVNGVGPRGYRHAYAEHAPAGDFWIQRNGTGQTHPHLLVLEVAAETGVVGLVGFTLFYGTLLWLLLRPTVANVVPLWLLCAAVAWLPLNAHLAFYGSYWSTLVWLLLGIGLAELRHDPAPAPALADGSSAAMSGAG